MLNKTKSLKYISLIIAFIAVSYSILHALEIPRLQGRVNDYAGMLSQDAINNIEQKLAELERSDSTQIVVLTIPSLEGEAIEDFSIHVAEKWKIGQKKLDNGAILLISKNDRKVRIEVGYGLEGKLTDLLSGRIVDQIIRPNFKSGNYDAGVTQAVDAMTGIVKGEFSAKDFNAKYGKSKDGFFSGNGIFVLFFFLFLIGIAGSIKRIIGGALGAVVFPIAGLFILPLSLWILLLIPIGFLAGFIIPIIFSIFGIGSGGGFSGGVGGGFSSFSSGGGGGFSGGGGSFGGGGASGDW